MKEPVDGAGAAAVAAVVVATGVPKVNLLAGAGAGAGAAAPNRAPGVVDGAVVEGAPKEKPPAGAGACVALTLPIAAAGVEEPKSPPEVGAVVVELAPKVKGLAELLAAGIPAPACTPVCAAGVAPKLKPEPPVALFALDPNTNPEVTGAGAVVAVGGATVALAPNVKPVGAPEAGFACGAEPNVNGLAVGAPAAAGGLLVDAPKVNPPPEPAAGLLPPPNVKGLLIASNSFRGLQTLLKARRKWNRVCRQWRKKEYLFLKKKKTVTRLMGQLAAFKACC